MGNGVGLNEGKYSWATGWVVDLVAGVGLVAGASAHELFFATFPRGPHRDPTGQGAGRQGVGLGPSF